MTITVLGDAFVDIIVPASNIYPGETYNRKSIVVCGGTANVALQIGKLGGKVNFIGKVGKDIFGEYFKNTLTSYNVSDFTYTDKTKPTGTCVSLCFDNNERSMIASRGANDYLSIDELFLHLLNIKKSDILYFTGYTLKYTGLRKTITDFISDMHCQCKIYFNPGAPNIIDDSFVSLIAGYVDCLILNFDEAKRITSENELEVMVEKIIEIVPTSIITLGNNGCIVISKKDGYVHVKSKKITALDTTGAGDSFSGGYIFGKVCGKDNIEAAKLGNNVAYDYLNWKRDLLI